MWKAVIPGAGMHGHVTPGGRQAIQPCDPGGLQAREKVSEPLCSQEEMALTQIKNC